MFLYVTIRLIPLTVNVLSNKFKGIVLKRVIDNLVTRHNSSNSLHAIKHLKDHFYKYALQNNQDRLAILERRVSLVRTKTLYELLESLRIDKFKLSWS